MSESLDIRKDIGLRPTQYLSQEFKKDLIVLHYTAGGTAKGAIDWWAQTKDRVATAFVVDLDGTIYQAFEPEFWAYHLGKGWRDCDQRSIGIEIANWGWLEPRGPRLLTYLGKDFCGFSEKDKYVRTPAYRGKQFWAPFPEAQVDATAQLVRSLCDRFAIPSAIHRDVKEGVCNPGFFRGYKGIATHTNFRSDKWDVGPAFPWEKIEAALAA